MRVAVNIKLSDAEQCALLGLLVPGHSSEQLALRARIVLLASEGRTNKEIARRLGVGRITAARWRERFAAEGVTCLRARRTGSGLRLAPHGAR